MDRQVLRFNHQHQAGRATPVPDLLHSGSPHGHADFPEGRWPDLKVAVFDGQHPPSFSGNGSQMKRTNLKNYTFCVHESHLLRAIIGETVVEKMAFQGGHQKASFQVYTLASYHKGLWINSTFRSMGILLEKKLYRATGSITIPLILSRFTQRKSATFLQSHQCLSFFFLIHLIFLEQF